MVKNEIVLFFKVHCSNVSKCSTLLDFAVILQLLTVKYHIYDVRLTTVIHTALWVFCIKFTVIYCICEFAVFYCLHKSSSATVNEEDRFLECAADILIGLQHYIYISYSARLRTSASSALTTVDGAEEKGFLDPSKPCRTTSALAGRSYASAGQAASALHSMAVLQVYQAKLLSAVDESEPDPATLRELRSATDLALRATKTTAQAIGRSMASLVVLERHLWLTLTEIKDADRVSFLDAPISPSGLFGPAVKGFAERFTEAQKASQAMRHFLPKRSSPAAAQGRPRTAPTLQPAKPAPAIYAPQPARTQQPRGRSRSARRHPPPKRQGPRLKIALDPVPPASS